MRFLSLSSTLVAIYAISTLVEAGDSSYKPDKAHYTFAIYRGKDVFGTAIAKTTLNCHPTGGTHPHAKAACSALDKAHGDFKKLKSTNTVCIAIFDPVTISIKGKRNGSTVNFERTYSNRCIMVSDSGRVFDF
ncbi:subtilisin inhibitor [Basidiobolus meristosporus CBS 931.73]|uniref:Subtilisin inhibitor n=1 Tax=Basidiobolus meristosporus CBS 931.73 TaxID=1314790 RepID=A0A1Y1YKF4_9FUNG|nr:subtilisin inhibitor [Basidiobolus meristosporus CBS 931.73]|eukprot:ORX98491.1 subtilisin inhibitor [Basidiobolus meristosporus CBS 931.73]